MRVVLYGVFAPLAVAIGTYAGVKHEQNSAPGSQFAPGTVPPTAGVLTHTGHSVVVPVSAPTGANRLVTLLCQPAPGASGYFMTAPRGAIVACTNGAIPVVVS